MAGPRRTALLLSAASTAILIAGIAIASSQIGNRANRTPPNRLDAALSTLGPATRPVVDTLACPTTSVCVAAGEYTPEKVSDVLFIAFEEDGRWHRIYTNETPFPSDGRISQISCSNANRCAAAGNYNDLVPLVVASLHGRWARLERFDMLRHDGSNSARGTCRPGCDVVTSDLVACAPDQTCTALIGFASPQQSAPARVSVLHGLTWSRPRALSTGRFPDAHLWSLKCSSATNCIAWGTFGPNQKKGFLAVEHAGRWRLHRQASSSQVSMLKAASALTRGDGSMGACASLSACTLVHVSKNELVFDDDVKGKATHAQVLDLSGYSVKGRAVFATSVQGFGCTLGGRCLVGLGVRNRQGPAGHPSSSQSVLLRKVDGRWSTPFRIPGFAGMQRDARVLGVACPPSGRCWIYGTYRAPRGQKSFAERVDW